MWEGGVLCGSYCHRSAFIFKKKQSTSFTHEQIHIYFSKRLPLNSHNITFKGPQTECTPNVLDRPLYEGERGDLPFLIG